jgi:hypothetical protein
LASYAAAFDGLHCVRCNCSCSTNSSTERTRIEKPQEVHFDCRKKTSLCTTGFRVKSYSLNSIGQSAGRRSGADLSASVRRLVLAIALTQYTCQKCGSRNSFPSHLSQAIRVRLPLVFCAFRLSSTGFLDTFDLFDSSLAARPGNFLQFPLLSFVSVLVCDLP